ncbi:terminase small subunit [Gemella sp. 19428wG2_WT2a]|nr:terminase small subunit [Gemella sp. 19428wG2_WT2a]TFU57693.1 terminase small subunit [Gemella sp. WT2a]
MNNQKIVDEIKEKASNLMNDWPSSRNKQKLFILEYMANGFTNATDAAIKAGFSEKSARSTANKMLTGCDKFLHIPEVVAKLQTIYEDKLLEHSVMSSLELKQFWTSIVRGQTKDIKFIGAGEGLQKVIEVEPDLATRINASDKLAKSLGMYQNNVNTNITGDITFELGTWEDED